MMLAFTVFSMMTATKRLSKFLTWSVVSSKLMAFMPMILRCISQVIFYILSAICFATLGTNHSCAIKPNIFCHMHFLMRMMKKKLIFSLLQKLLCKWKNIFSIHIDQDSEYFGQPCPSKIFIGPIYPQKCSQTAQGSLFMNSCSLRH